MLHGCIYGTLAKRLQGIQRTSKDFKGLQRTSDKFHFEVQTETQAGGGGIADKMFPGYKEQKKCCICGRVMNVRYQKQPTCCCARTRFGQGCHRVSRSTRPMIFLVGDLYTNILHKDKSEKQQGL